MQESNILQLVLCFRLIPDVSAVKLAYALLFSLATINMMLSKCIDSCVTEVVFSNSKMRSAHFQTSDFCKKLTSFV